MNYTFFTEHVLTLKGCYQFSITSWFRTKRRNTEVGGRDDSFHLLGLAVDVILDNPADKARFIQAAKRLGLDAIDENDHIHLEVK